jgi:hypothetical protein
MRTITALTGGLLALVLAACSGGGVGTSQSQGAPLETAANGAHGGRDPARFLQHLDTNGDGKVQVSELPARMQKLAKADTNADGVISVEELTAFHAVEAKARFAEADKNADGAIDATEAGDRWTHLQAADANKDGKVTQTELDQARAAGTLHGFGGGHHGGHHAGAGGDHDGAHAGMMQRLDTNKDGILQASEIPEKMRPWLDRADTNHDGSLTKDELDAMKKAHEAEE